MDFLILQQLGISLGIGFLLGLERERSESSIAGIRTLPLISAFGTICAQLGQYFGHWIVAAGLLSLTATLIFANVTKMKNGDSDPGMTTEVAVLLLYCLGAFLVVGNMAASIVLAGAMAVLLYIKQPLHQFVSKIGERDMRAIMQFVVLSLIILPVLPNKDYGPYGVWNPFEIWLMVVLIVGISLGGYVAFKLFGAHAGTLLGGVIGGLISSTATTVSFARRVVAQEALAPLGTLVIMIAACVSLVRVLVEVAAVAPSFFIKIAPPLVAMLLACCGISTALFFRTQKKKEKMPEQKNPADLKSALVFGLLYALVLLAVAAAKDHLGDNGLFIVGIISGLTDMDAITLSTSHLVQTGNLDSSTAWRTILLAAMANFAFKFAIITSLGPLALTRRVAVAFGLAIAIGGAIFWLWPEVSPK